MRQQDGIRQRYQLGRDVRLVGVDVEAGGADGAVAERCDQRRLVDHDAAADVDEDAVGAERLQDTRANQAAGRGIAG